MSTNVIVAILAGLLTFGATYVVVPIAIALAFGELPAHSRVAAFAAFLALVAGFAVLAGLQLSGVQL